MLATVGSDQSAVCSVSLFKCLTPEYASLEGVRVPNCKMQVSVRGGLRKHSQFWIEELIPSSFVHDNVISEYRFPF